MALQARRGQYNQFDPSKMVPGEPAAVLSGDPNAPSGKAFYVCYQAGDVKRMVSIEDLEQMVERGDFDGVDVVSGAVNDAGNLIITLSNGTLIDVGHVVGPKGDDGTVAFEELTDEQKLSLKGDKGDKGNKGDKGDTGDVNYATFDVLDGRLFMYTNPEMKNTTFYLEDGKLCVEVT